MERRPPVMLNDGRGLNRAKIDAREMVEEGRGGAQRLLGTRRNLVPETRV